MFLTSVVFCNLWADDGVLQRATPSLLVKKKVVFDRLDVERIERKKIHYHLDLQQAKKVQRAGYFVGGVITTVLGCYLGHALWKSFSPRAQQPDGGTITLMDDAVERLTLERTRRELEAWDRIRERYTFWGRVKDQVDQGLTIVLCSFVVSGVVHLISSMSHQSFDQVKKLFGKDADILFLATQSMMLKNMHRMGDSLFDFIDDLSSMTYCDGRVDEKFEDYFYADLKMGYEAFVRSLEDFIAIVLESLEQEVAADQKNFEAERALVVEREIVRLSLFVDEIGSYLEYVTNGAGTYDQKDIWIRSKAYMKKISVSMSCFITSLGGLLYGKEFSVS